jgi:hypothetical protein
VPEPDGARALRVACVAWAALLLAGSAVYSARAPLGAWQNQLFGQPTWSEFDPAGYYVAAAHQLAWGEAPIFVGHPGTPLLVVLRGVESAWCAAAAAHELACGELVARNLPALFLLAKLALTLLHLASFAALYFFARGLLGDASAACLAVLGYATSLPVLFYLSRISVEPIGMLCLFAAFACVWRSQDLARCGRLRGALVCAAAAGLAAVTAAFAKLNLLGPLPLLLGLSLLCERIPRRARLACALVFAAAAASAALGWSELVDWRRFFARWSEIARPAPGTTSGEGLLVLCEGAFAALGLAGWAGCLRRAERRSRVIQVSACAALALLPFAYRVAIRGGFVPFHYLFVAVGVLAACFGDAALRLLRRLSLPTTGARGALAALALVALVHGVAVAAVLESRRRDAERFEPQRPVFEQLARLGPGEQLGVERQLYASRRFRGWLRALHAIRLPSRLRAEFEGLFAPVAAIPPGAPRVAVPALGAELRLPGPP